MGELHQIANGFGAGLITALSLQNLAYCLIGVVTGTVIGVLPGIGPMATIAMLLPITFHITPVGALIMLSGIYYGAQYGGSTTAILVNLPGEASSVVTTLDGYQMALQGKAGTALSVAAVGSLFGGLTGIATTVIFGPLLTEMALKLMPADYCSLMVLGLVSAIVLASGSIVKAIAMIVLGLMIGVVGTDVNDGMQRLTFGIPQLVDGFDFTPIAMGLFGISEIIHNIEKQDTRTVSAVNISSLWPSRADAKAAVGPVLRGTGIGLLLGMLPGGGATMASFASYMIEKKWSRTPQLFGKGAIQGVAGPESANNAAAQTSFIPMLTLGLPSNAVMALMIGAMVIHGIQPGPQVLTSNPELFWGMIASMAIGNLMLVIINLPMIGIWIRLLTIPYRYLFPAILMFCCIGAYSIDNSVFQILVLAGFSLLGYIFLKLGCEPAPFLLGLVLGPMLEEYFRRTMILSGGELGVFVERPVSLILLVTAALLLSFTVVPKVSKVREEAFQEEG
jgi:TctA family transporter